MAARRMMQRRIVVPAPEPEPEAPPEAAPKRRRVEPRPEAPPEAAETPEPQQSSGHKAKIVEATRSYMRQYYLDHREAFLERRRRKWRLEHPKPQGSAATQKCTTVSSQGAIGTVASNRTKEGATSEGATSGKGTCDETLGNGNST